MKEVTLFLDDDVATNDFLKHRVNSKYKNRVDHEQVVVMNVNFVFMLLLLHFVTFYSYYVLQLLLLRREKSERLQMTSKDKKDFNLSLHNYCRVCIKDKLQMRK